MDRAIAAGVARYVAAGALLLVLQQGPGAAAALAAQETASAPGSTGAAYVRHPEAVKAIAQIKSPYCIGFMLEVCSSAQGAALRDSIEALADEGWPADSIVNWVLANHGEEYLALPRREGKALVAWVVPPLVILLGFGMVLVALRQMRGNRQAPPTTTDITAADEEKLKEALRELEAEEDVPFI
jgi:cytochrome c-type biogenesis protein CcmH/NrfF